MLSHMWKFLWIAELAEYNSILFRFMYIAICKFWINQSGGPNINFNINSNIIIFELITILKWIQSYMLYMVYNALKL